MFAPGRYEVWINDVTDLPGFFMGMVEAGARHVTGSAADAVQMKSRDGNSCTYELLAH